MPGLTLEQWNLLSQEEQAIVLKLGFKLRETVSKRRKPSKKKPFTLAVHISCSLCQREHTLFWRMAPTLKDGLIYWQGRRLKCSGLILPDKRDERRQPSCCLCIKELCSWEKEAIARKLLLYARFLSLKEAIK